MRLNHKGFIREKGMRLNFLGFVDLFLDFGKILVQKLFLIKSHQSHSSPFIFGPLQTIILIQSSRSFVLLSSDNDDLQTTLHFYPPKKKSKNSEPLQCLSPCTLIYPHAH